jgi:hypothetical protein
MSHRCVLVHPVKRGLPHAIFQSQHGPQAHIPLVLAMRQLLRRPLSSCAVGALNQALYRRRCYRLLAMFQGRIMQLRDRWTNAWMRRPCSVNVTALTTDMHLTQPRLLLLLCTVRVRRFLHRTHRRCTVLHRMNSAILRPQPSLPWTPCSYPPYNCPTSRPEIQRWHFLLSRP